MEGVGFAVVLHFLGRDEVAGYLIWYVVGCVFEFVGFDREEPGESEGEAHWETFCEGPVDQSV